MDEHYHTGWHSRNCWFKDGCKECSSCEACKEINSKYKELVNLYFKHNQINSTASLGAAVVNLTKNLFKMACDVSRMSREHTITAATMVFQYSVSHFLDCITKEEAESKDFEIAYFDSFDEVLKDVKNQVFKMIWAKRVNV